MTTPIWTIEELEAEIGKGSTSNYDMRFLKKELSRQKNIGPFTIICQWTGLAFEASSKRYKTHPGMAATNEWPSSYRNEFANAVRAAGTFDAPVVAAVKARIIADLNYADDQRQQRENEYRDAAKQRHYDKNARDYQNGILRAGGFRWIKEDEESMDFAGPNAFSEAYGNRDYVWLLIDESGKEYSVQGAMEVLATRGNTQAQRWLADRKEA